MTYDEALADRIRDAMETEPHLTEKRMFGGLAFLVDGHMAVVILSKQQGLMVRVDPDEVDALLARDHVGPMIMSGRPARGWLRIDPPGLTDDEQLGDWVDRAAAFVLTLPAK
ncbi:MAG: TfoX/Sxy family protein [Gordonia paraffinivorans]